MSNLLFNRYEITKELGQGGFGKTFLAVDTGIPSKRFVVIKKLIPVHKEQKYNECIEELFNKEASFLEELGKDHPHIPELYGYFEDSGSFFLVQEYIDGKTLAKSTPIKEADAVKFLCSLLKTLMYVHSKKLIHRDIKPENIIINNQNNLPVLIDFGAVKDAMGKTQRSNGSIVSSVIIGTRGFMSPEQSIGRPTFSSDVYSLGMTIIYALTGKNPIEFEYSSLTGELEWEKDVPDLNPNLKRVLNKSIYDDRSQRYQTAEDALKDLSDSYASKTSTYYTKQTSNLPSTYYTTPTSQKVSKSHRTAVNQKTSTETVVVSKSNSTSYSTLGNKVYHSSPPPQKGNGFNVFAIVFLLVLLGSGGLFSMNMYYQQQAEARLLEIERQEEERKRIEAQKRADEQEAKRQEAESKIREAEKQAEREEAERQEEQRRRRKAEEEAQRLRNKANDDQRKPIENSLSDRQSPKLNTTPEEPIVIRNIPNESVSESKAISVIENLYYLLSEKSFNEARFLYSPQLSRIFPDDFFSKFKRVTVEDLQITSRTDNSINFTGKNTYVWFDGSTQRETRSYTVRNIDGELKITSSEFIKVIKLRR